MEDCDGVVDFGMFVGYEVVEVGVVDYCEVGVECD